MSQSQKPHVPQEGTGTARMGRARAAGEAALSHAEPGFARAGFPDASLVLRWPDIVGPEIARIAEPLKWQAGPEGAVLTLKCESGAAVFLQHQTRPLIERLNAYLGPGQIARLKFTPGRLSQAPAPPDHPAKARRKAAEISTEIQPKPSLSAALERLAQARTARPR